MYALNVSRRMAAIACFSLLGSRCFFSEFLGVARAKKLGLLCLQG